MSQAVIDTKKSNTHTCVLCSSGQTSIFYDGEAQRYFQCQACGLTFLDGRQRLNAEDEKARYDLHENSPDDEGYVTFLRKLTDVLIPKLTAGAKGLDFGCGPGPAIKSILEQQGFYVANYDPVYFPDESTLNQTYDFVTCSEVIEHLYNPWEEFQLLDSLIKDNGHLGLMTQMLSDDVTFDNWWYRSEPSHVCFYQKQTLQWIGEKLNWQTEFPVKNVVIYSK